MWRIERDEAYFKIFDSKKDIVGYFDPDYGDLFPREKELELIDNMHKNHDKIPGGFLMVPMVKFRIFDTDQVTKIEELEQKLDDVKKRISIWKNLLLESKKGFYNIRVSHTDQDMLSITFPIKFDFPVALDKKSILENLQPTLDLLQRRGLL